MGHIRESKQSGFDILVILVFLIVGHSLGLGVWGCAPEQMRTASAPAQQYASRSDSTITNQIITEIQGDKFKKSTTYPYLTVKFRQNDTEVELMLDPQSTNLALELVRGPDGFMQVMHGDSVLVDDTDAPPSDSLKRDIQEGPMLSDHLTDEIMEDINLAQRLFYQKRYEDALRVLRASLKKRETATAYALGGSIYYVNGDLAGAVRAWENALKINPELDKVRSLIERHTN